MSIKGGGQVSRRLAKADLRTEMANQAKAILQTTWIDAGRRRAIDPGRHLALIQTSFLPAMVQVMVDGVLFGRQMPQIMIPLHIDLPVEIGWRGGNGDAAILQPVRHPAKRPVAPDSGFHLFPNRGGQPLQQGSGRTHGPLTPTAGNGSCHPGRRHIRKGWLGRRRDWRQGILPKQGSGTIAENEPRVVVRIRLKPVKPMRLHVGDRLPAHLESGWRDLRNPGGALAVKDTVKRQADHPVASLPDPQAIIDVVVFNRQIGFVERTNLLEHRPADHHQCPGDRLIIADGLQYAERSGSLPGCPTHHMPDEVMVVGTFPATATISQQGSGMLHGSIGVEQFAADDPNLRTHGMRQQRFDRSRPGNLDIVVEQQQDLRRAGGDPQVDHPRKIERGCRGDDCRRAVALQFGIKRQRPGIRARMVDDDDFQRDPGLKAEKPQAAFKQIRTVPVGDDHRDPGWRDRQRVLDRRRRQGRIRTVGGRQMKQGFANMACGKSHAGFRQGPQPVPPGTTGASPATLAGQQGSGNQEGRTYVILLQQKIRIPARRENRIGTLAIRIEPVIIAKHKLGERGRRGRIDGAVDAGKGIGIDDCPGGNEHEVVATPQPVGRRLAEQARRRHLRLVKETAKRNETGRQPRILEQLARRRTQHDDLNIAEGLPAQRFQSPDQGNGIGAGSDLDAQREHEVP